MAEFAPNIVLSDDEAFWREFYWKAAEVVDGYDYHELGALNIVRIIGIFARLTTRDGKPRYEAFLPRLWGYLDRCLADPALGGLKAWFDRHVPPEARR